MDLLHCKGYRYSFDPSACRECEARCCRGRPGFIWVTAGDIGKIAEYLQESLVDIMGRYLERVDNRLSIRERYRNGQHECVFFDTQAVRCSIYAVRPPQCRRFPFWPYFRGREDKLIGECPGVRLDG